MTDIRDAITALRTLLEALPVAGTWRYDDKRGMVTSSTGDHIVEIITDEEGEYIATVASPDVTEALARLLGEIARHSRPTAHGPDDCDGTCIDAIHQVAEAVAAAITRRSTT